MNMSPANLWKLIVNPWRIFLILDSPATFSSSADAIAALFPDVTAASAQSCLSEFLRNDGFLTSLDKGMREKRQRPVAYEKWNEFLYMAIRFSRPQVVFETGVFDGQSSAIILQALNDNGKGLLVSIDLPADKIMARSTNRMKEAALPQASRPGWLIPDNLRARHVLALGDTKVLLPQLLRQYPDIDIFLHDSLHTFKHQYFEYMTAWPHISDGGLLLSDDIFWSAAFHKFCREKKKKYIYLGSFGAVRK